MSNKEVGKRDNFSTKLGVVAAAAGSAIGLGNIWRFSYITGEYGGASFLVLYLACIAIIGIPIMIAEFVIGRRTQKNAIGAYRKLAPGKPWVIIGWMGNIAVLMILSFYSVIAGWCMSYVFKAITNAFAGKSPEQIQQIFTAVRTNTWTPIMWQLIFLVMTCFIVFFGIKNGIEKYSKILMPLLFLIIIILDIRALTLDGAKEGLEFLFKPDWSKIDLKVLFIAMGQAFFTLSIGVGTMTTYGSYIRKKERLGLTAVQVAFTDTLVAILSGLVIFPTVFSFGLDPSEGMGLAFVTLPNIFLKLPGGYFFGVLFFLLLAIAALTSSISLLEVPVAFLTEEFKSISRKKACIIVTIFVAFTGILCSLSQGPWTFKIMGMSFLDLLDYMANNWLMPLGGLLISLFVGWYLDKNILIDEINSEGQKAKYIPLLIFILKYIAPIAIIIVFLNSLGVFNFLKG